MLNAFYNPSVPTLNRIGVNYYKTYKCYSTSTSSVGAANTARHNVRCGGYLGLTNNSLDHTINIIEAYNSSIPDPGAFYYPAPNDWYAELGNWLEAPGWTGATGLRQDNSGTGTDPHGHC